VKRLFDISVASLLLVLFFPVWIVVLVLVLICDGRPFLFIQNRPGKNAKLFRLYKFRTMRMGHKSDSARLTKLGKVLRRFSLDELPQLWNVVRGDMSIVGPRPLLEQYLPLYNSQQARRHEVRPGITGWAQVHGRNALCWEDRFDLDLWYAENHSLLVDFRIILMTVGKVFSGSGVSAEGQATVEPFKGTPKI
jgi:sugar transferase EpsL